MTFRPPRLVANLMSIALVTLLATTALTAQPARQPNAQDLMEAVKVLAAPDLEGRRTGYARQRQGAGLDSRTVRDRPIDSSRWQL